MSLRSVKCDCGAIVSAEGKSILDKVVCHACGTSVTVSPRRLDDAHLPLTSPDPWIYENAEQQFDVFICHASEDKNELASPLAAALERRGFRVWYDKAQLGPGKSIRRNIDRALTQSRFGVVLLSPSFFSKEWANRELDGIIARGDERIVVLPVLHGISVEQLKEYSPTLADRVSVSTDQGVEYVADQIQEAIKQGLPRPILAANDADTTLASFRRKIILSANRNELKQCLYEIENYRSRNPYNVEARMLKDVIEEALLYETKARRILDTAVRQWRRFALFLLLIIGSLSLYSFVRPTPVTIIGSASPAGDRLIVAAAPGSSLRIELSWQDDNDLDLSVIDPSNTQISYWIRVTKIGGLDQDLVKGPGKETIDIHTSRLGNYEILIRDYSDNGTPDFKLTILIDGKARKIYAGTLEDGRRTYKLQLHLER